MDCDTYHELIVADLDDTLSASERDAVRGHLEECAVCRNARALEAEFAGYLRRGSRVVEAPEGVEARLRAILERAPAPLVLRRPPWLAPIAALLVAATVTFAALRPAATDFLRPATDDYRLAASARLPLDVTTSDPAVLARYFDASGRFSFPAVVPDLTTAGCRLVGGAIRERSGVFYAVSVYDLDGEIVLSHRFRDAGGRDDGAADVATRRYDRADDLSIWTTRQRGVVCCITVRTPTVDVESLLLPLIDG